MRFFTRVLARHPVAEGNRAPARATERGKGLLPVMQPRVLGGHQTLEVVGESHYQDHLWQLAGGFCADPIRCRVTAVLEAEPENVHDRNAIRVDIEGAPVGYLSREDASIYLPGLTALTSQHGRPVGLDGQIVGGGSRGDGIGMLGVFLDHDPADFGVRKHQAMHIGELRSGLSQAIASDLDDDRYDLSWLDQLSGRHSAQDVVVLRGLLEDEDEPIDRHFMFSELSKCLYKSRDAFASALDEFDAICAQHDAEMDVIRAALVEKFGCVPVIDLFRQAAIRCQKNRDWEAQRRWAERGLAIYGRDAARPEAVGDLQKRLAHAEAKLWPSTVVSRGEPAVAGSPVLGLESIETLTCVQCGGHFRRVATRGRKPHRCPTCRGS